ncbi:MAG: hypothetical protein LBC73_04995 [Oscillospiraceae bacterium]|jgi:hypothetical protein|nr:hypothetical protein [Oscillospiraceae bacterium]
MEDTSDNWHGLLREIIEAIINHPIIIVLVVLIVIILLLFITRAIFKNTIYGRFVQHKILSNPFLSLYTALLTIGMTTIWIWWEFEDEISLIAWSVIMSSAVVILAIVYSVIQSRNTFREQAALAQLRFIPCLYVSTLMTSSNIILTNRISKNSTIRQTFTIECVSEHPAFNINWFSWTNAAKPYLYKEYEKTKQKIPLRNYTAVKGKKCEITISLDSIHLEQVLVAEYKDINRGSYVQNFDLKWNNQLNWFEVIGIDSPTPIATSSIGAKKQ